MMKERKEKAKSEAEKGSENVFFQELVSYEHKFKMEKKENLISHRKEEISRQIVEQAKQRTKKTNKGRPIFS